MAESDADLILRWRAGDESAFEAIVRRWEPSLAQFLSRLAADSQVPDLLQEIFLRVYRAGPVYRENGHFSTWLFQIALNVARDASRRVRPAEPLTGEGPPTNGESAHDRCERGEMAALLAQAVAELPPELREVIALRHDRGMKFEEMARMLGVPATTLKSRFSSALIRLKERLRDLGLPPQGES
jgi:RNA polymerase sigma-70 factor (ECF subfamily)